MLEAPFGITHHTININKISLNLINLITGVVSVYTWMETSRVKATQNNSAVKAVEKDS